jgi:hypothetical protein
MDQFCFCSEYVDLRKIQITTLGLSKLIEATSKIKRVSNNLGDLLYYFCNQGFLCRRYFSFHIYLHRNKFRIYAINVHRRQFKFWCNTQKVFSLTWSNITAHFPQLLYIFLCSGEIDKMVQFVLLKVYLCHQKSPEMWPKDKYNDWSNIANWFSSIMQNMAKVRLFKQIP